MIYKTTSSRLFLKDYGFMKEIFKKQQIKITKIKLRKILEIKEFNFFLKNLKILNQIK